MDVSFKNLLIVFIMVAIVQSILAAGTHWYTTKHGSQASNDTSLVG
jgi:flagellar basal body-associated protein FliL